MKSLQKIRESVKRRVAAAEEQAVSVCGNEKHLNYKRDKRRQGLDDRLDSERGFRFIRIIRLKIGRI